MLLIDVLLVFMKFIEENCFLLCEGCKIVEVLGNMLVLLVEVVLYDLIDFDYFVVVIVNNLFGCQVGDVVMELGLVCLVDLGFLEVIENYVNWFFDGCLVKSILIGLKNSCGDYVVVICLNMDVLMFGVMMVSFMRLMCIDVVVLLVFELFGFCCVEDVCIVFEQFVVVCNIMFMVMMFDQCCEVMCEFVVSGLLNLCCVLIEVVQVFGVVCFIVYIYFFEDFV